MVDQLNDPNVFIYRLGQAEKRLDTIHEKLLTLSNGVIEMKVELQHVAKNEGKTSGAISGVVTGTIISILGIVAQLVLKG